MKITKSELKEMIREALREELIVHRALKETYVSDAGDEFTSINGAMYVARELVYYFVDDANEAEQLIDWAENTNLNWDGPELNALDTLIVNALEGANEHEAAFEYHQGNFPIHLANKIDRTELNAMDALINSCTDDNQRKSLLYTAMHYLNLEGITD